MVRRLAALVVIVVSASVAGAEAQQMKVYRYSDRDASRFEVVPFAGYVWSIENEFYYGLAAGTLDFKDASYFGVYLDATVHPGTQVRLMYRREDTEAVLRTFSGRQTFDAAIEYWHIGGISGVERGNVLSYGMITLGGTRYLAQDDDVWKFSMIFGIGAKVYTSGKFGFQIQGSFPFTFVGGGDTISCGGGGCFTSTGGSGLGQIDVSGGLVIGL